MQQTISFFLSPDRSLGTKEINLATMFSFIKICFFDIFRSVQLSENNLQNCSALTGLQNDFSGQISAYEEHNFSVVNRR